jgi:methionine synthase I (cobalamin-dependent)
MSRSKIILMDGAMGSLLLTLGFSADDCLESLNLSRPRLIEEIHRSYLDAGAAVILANTFGANRARLAERRWEKKLEAINRAGIRIARRSAGRKPVFASLGPLGRASRKMTFSEMFGLFKEQARALEKESPAGYLVETMTSLTEAEAATAAARQVSDRTIMTLMTRPPRGSDFSADAASLVAATLRSSGADVIGANCGVGPEDSHEVLKALSRVDGGPFAVRVSAGLPGRVLPPEDFAEWGIKFAKLGCRWIGGCCGTTPAHIRALREIL